MANPIGSTSDLSDRAVVVPVVLELKGKACHFHLKIDEDTSIAHYLSSFASVVVTGTLQFELSAPVSSTVAATCVVAVVPDKYKDWPTTQLQIRRLEGAITIKDAILVPSSLTYEGKVREISSSLKPRTLLGHPPVIVGYLHVAGGSDSTVTTLTVHVPILADGIAHHKTW